MHRKNTLRVYHGLIFTLIVFSASFPDGYSWKILCSDDTFDLYFKDIYAGKYYQKAKIDSVEKTISIVSRIVIEERETNIAGLTAMQFEERRVYDFAGNLENAQQTLASATGKSQWQLSRNLRHKWELKISTGTMAKIQPVDSIRDNCRTNYAIQQAVLNKKAAPRDIWYDTLFDMTGGTNLAVETRCVSVPDNLHRTYLFVNRIGSFQREENWEMDSSGNILSQEIPPFFIAKRRMGKSDTLQKKQALAGTQISSLFTVHSQRGPGRNECVAVTFTAGVKPHSSVRQWYSKNDSVYIVKKSGRICSDSVPLHKRMRKEEWLESTVVLQADHPDIRRIARQVAATEKNRCAVIRKMTMHVYNLLQKKYVATFSNAVETLKAGYGDCGEHAALLAALLRAAGIEATMVFGLVYFQEKQGYFYHAWVAARADSLVFADPALGVFPAVSGYIPLLLDDDGKNQVCLIDFIGRISVSYVSCSEK